jgi:heme-degrading monooxygenase HmoA
MSIDETWPLNNIVARRAPSAGFRRQTVTDYFVWMTTRRIKPGALRDFEQAWRPEAAPPGMRNAYAYWSADETEVIGVSFWESKEACDTWRATDAEARRRQAMAPFIVEERDAFYRGRELTIPAR